MPKILVIDDEPAMRDMLRGILESVDFEVVVAANGRSGLKLFEEHRPDLVITDILMPEKDGIETLRAIRKLDPQARVVAISGGGHIRYTEVLQFAQDLGAVQSLAKPFRRDDILAAVRRALG